MGAGRPEVWTPEKKQEAIDKILARIATSRDSLKTICSGDDKLPDAQVFFSWLRGNEELNNLYAHAKEAQADVIFEEMLDIADTPQRGVTTKTTANGTDITEEDMLGHRRLQIDTRKWALGKLRPKKYGDKLDLEHSGQINTVHSYKVPDTRPIEAPTA